MPYRIKSPGKILPSYTTIGVSLYSASASPHFTKLNTQDIWKHWVEELLGNDFHRFSSFASVQMGFEKEKRKAEEVT